MVGERLMSVTAISGTKLVLGVVIEVGASPTKTSKNRSMVWRR
jgi:hypothetical protein